MNVVDCAGTDYMALTILDVASTVGCASLPPLVLQEPTQDCQDTDVHASRPASFEAGQVQVLLGAVSLRVSNGVHLLGPCWTMLSHIENELQRGAGAQDICMQTVLHP